MRRNRSASMWLADGVFDMKQPAALYATLPRRLTFRGHAGDYPDGSFNEFAGPNRTRWGLAPQQLAPSGHLHSVHRNTNSTASASAGKGPSVTEKLWRPAIAPPAFDRGASVEVSQPSTLQRAMPAQFVRSVRQSPGGMLATGRQKVQTTVCGTMLLSNVTGGGGRLGCCKRSETFCPGFSSSAQKNLPFSRGSGYLALYESELQAICCGRHARLLGDEQPARRIRPLHRARRAHRHRAPRKHLRALL